MTKKLFNEQSSVVDEALKGLIALNPSLNLIENHRIVYCFSNNNEVSLISGKLKYT